MFVYFVTKFVFRCFWIDPVELTAAVSSWYIADTDYIVCALERHAILQNIMKLA